MQNKSHRRGFYDEEKTAYFQCKWNVITEYGRTETVSTEIFHFRFYRSLTRFFFALITNICCIHYIQSITMEMIVYTI